MYQRRNKSSAEVEGMFDPTLVETILDEFKKTLKSEMKWFHERMDQLESNRRKKDRNTHNLLHMRRRTTSTKEEESFMDSYDKEEYVGQGESSIEKTTLCQGESSIAKTALRTLVKEDEEVINQGEITLVPLTMKQVHEDQVSLEKKSEKKEMSENEGESKKKIEKTETENKEKESVMERETERETNSYAKAIEVKRASFLNQPMVELLSKEAFFSNQLDDSFPNFVISPLQELGDVVPKEVGFKWGQKHTTKSNHKIVFDPGGDLRTNHF